MALIRVTSPHVHKASRTADVMRLVLLATVPGIAAMTLFFGWGTLIQLIWCSVLAVGMEAAVIKLRRRPVLFYLKDYSALVTAILLALAIPPFAPWWLSLIGVFVAIVIAKHLYGGLGQNPFNPAMVAYALLLVSFPVEMTRWSAPNLLLDDGWAGLGTTLSFIFVSTDMAVVDQFTGATPLDAFKHRGGLTASEAWQQVTVLSQGAAAWYWVNAAFLAGGVFLIYRKVFTWHTPASMLATLAVLSLLFFGFDSDHYADPLFHLMVGGTMLGAFFIATDPVTAATSNKGKLYYGAGIGALIFIIRTWGNYPDAVAFAVLLMNLAAPFIDLYSQPRSYGHSKANRGLKGDS